MARRVLPTARLRPDKGGPDRWELSAGDARVEVIPSRGALISRFAIAGDEILYCERVSGRGAGQPVLGGAPVLFPVAGRVSGDRYAVGERSYPMRPGGLARLAPWQVIDVGAARLTLELRSTDITRITYPFEFALRLVVDPVLAGGRGLSLELEVENRDTCPLPYHVGLMPHFLVPQAVKPEVVLETPALQAHDELAGTALTLARPGAVALGEGEVDVSLVDHVRGPAKESTLRLLVPQRPPRLLTFSSDLPVVAIHTLHFKDFVAVGAWSARRDALVTGRGLRTLAPGASVRYQLTISA